MYALKGPFHVHPSFIHLAVIFANSRLIALSGNVYKRENSLGKYSLNMQQTILWELNWLWSFLFCVHQNYFSKIFSYGLQIEMVS